MEIWRVTRVSMVDGDRSHIQVVRVTVIMNIVQIVTYWHHFITSGRLMLFLTQRC